MNFEQKDSCDQKNFIIQILYYFIYTLDQDYEDWIKDVESNPISEEKDVPNIELIEPRACKNNIGEIVPCAHLDPNQYFSLRR